MAETLTGRPDEIEPGDSIEVVSEEDVFNYTVTEKPRVEPDAIWVLSGGGKDKEITLVTCDPVINPDRRLVIKGIIIE